MKKNRFLEGKKPAQAMVEFAIALPILLLLLYGILEAGRLLFVYSTVVTASRQAARYGSATGEGLGGHPRYQDCRGMRDAADQVSFLGEFEDNDIVLQYDSGPSTTVNTYCSGVDSDSSLSTAILEGNRTRLVVTVTENFQPLVRLVPFFERDITATSARTILYSVPIVVEQEQEEWFKTPTTLEITLDDPDYSEINQPVTVTVKLLDDNDAPVPNATVNISGADVNCQITAFNNNGIGSCTVVFSTQGLKVLTAIYDGDDDYLGSTDTEDHEVRLIQTVTTILSDLPDPSTKDEQFIVIVEVTGSQTPTGTVEIDGGQGVRCTISLSGGTGSCPLNYNNAGGKTLTATYIPDNSIFEASEDTEPHTVVEYTPTPTYTPTPVTPTPTPTSTPTPTPSPTPTMTPTPVTSCNLVTHGPISLAGGVMSMTISNPNPFPIVMKDITVTWNDDKGHNFGNKQLFLTSVTVGSTTIWTGEIDKTDTYTIPTTAVIPAYPPGTTTITFYFHQTYDNRDETEKIYINLSTPGCERYPIDSSQP